MARTSEQPVMAPEPYAVPDTDTLRQRALAASWRRDRVVGRRRLALRWTLWAGARYVLPAVAVLALALGLFHWLSQADASPAPPPADGLKLKPATTIQAPLKETP